MIKLFYKIEGRGGPVVLLHGMAASHRYWYKVVDRLAPYARVLRVDLLGFGRSPKPDDANYTIAEHVSAIKNSVTASKITTPFLLAGHSMGAILAAEYARAYPDDVDKIAMINTPLYKNAVEANKGVTNGSRLRRLFYFGSVSKFICGIVCKLPKSVSKKLYMMHEQDVDSSIEEDIADHTYRSYSRSMEHVILQNDTMKNLDKIKTKLLLVIGVSDDPIAVGNSRHISQKLGIKSLEIAGSHGLPLETPNKIASAILDHAEK